jgi:hypothetical protein
MGLDRRADGILIPRLRKASYVVGKAFPTFVKVLATLDFKFSKKPSSLVMKKFLPIFLLFASCAPKLIPLKNNYDTKPFELTTSSDFETVWGKIIEMFAKKGIGVKIIDKSSGFIVAQNTTAPITTEDKNGKLLNPNAWAVTQKLYDPGSRKYFYAKEGTIEWNIYIKRNIDNTTTININLIDVTTVTSVYSLGYTVAPTTKTFKTRALTTGVFEKQIAEQIK